MGLFRGVKRAAALWAPQLVHLLRQASAALLLVVLGFKFGVEFGYLVDAGRTRGSLWLYISALFVVNRLLAAWESRGCARQRRGFEVTATDHDNSNKGVG